MRKEVERIMDRGWPAREEYKEEYKDGLSGVVVRKDDESEALAWLEMFTAAGAVELTLTGFATRWFTVVEDDPDGTPYWSVAHHDRLMNAKLVLYPGSIEKVLEKLDA